MKFQLVIIILFFLLKLIFPSSSTNSFVFNGFTGANLSINGLTEITTGGLLKLTNFTKESLGHAFFPTALQFRENYSSGNIMSFSTTFIFAIVPIYPDVCGHGIAFALSPSRDLPWAMPSQHLGLFNFTDNGKSNNHMLAVEFDTVQTIEFKDIDDNHVGIDATSLTSRNSTSAAFFNGTSKKFESMKLVSGDRIQVWIDYNGTEMRLSVAIAPLGTPKPAIPLLSSIVNLSSILANDVYVGFSASNGGATSTHYVLGWSFSLNGEAQSLDPSKLPSLPHQQNGTKKKTQLFAIILIVILLILLILSATIIMSILQRRKKYAEVREEWEIEYGPHRFSYRDIFKATKGFRNESLIGVGGFGHVYKGILPNSQLEVAVKKISHDSRQGMREFIAEIVSMGRLRHRNLVQLLGYCRRQGELLIIYDFMPNGSLDKLLFSKQHEAVLSWTHRFQIIKGVASGLLYLHEGWEQVVVHRDIKAANVLLDGEMNARLGDFGLARLYDHGSNPQTTHIVGTLGYLAPELSKTGKATTKTDVYAFGAFLLEVSCGRRPMEVHMNSEMLGLVELVLECWKRGSILEAADKKLADEYVVEEMDLVLKLGLICSHPEPMSRPSMKQVMQILEGDANLPCITAEKLSASASQVMYDESFDNFIISYPSISDMSEEGSSSNFLSSK